MHDDMRHDGATTTKRRVLFAVGVSLLLHVGLLLLIPKLWSGSKDHKKAALQVWLTERPKTSDELPKKAMKVVDLPKVSIQVKPKSANYWAEQDHATSKEMRAKHNKALAAPSSPAMAHDDSVMDAPKPLATGHRVTGKNKHRNDPLGIRLQFGGNPAHAATMPEHLPELPEGEAGQLNTWQWRHAPFFNRIKARIGQIWSPQSQIARFDPQGALLGNMDRVTVLSVTIDKEGRLAELLVSEPSGVAYLDEEAQRALRESAPFLFPPQELFAQNQEFSFTFAFHLYLNRGFSLDIDW